MQQTIAVFYEVFTKPSISIHKLDYCCSLEMEISYLLLQEPKKQWVWIIILGPIPQMTTLWLKVVVELDQ